MIYKRTGHFFLFFAVVLLVGCEQHFVSYRTHPDTGERLVTYETYEFCGLLIDRDGGFALFVAENGGFPNKGDLNIWFYNLGSASVNVGVNGFSLYNFKNVGVGNVEVPAAARVQLLRHRYRFEDPSGGSFPNYDLFSYSIVLPSGSKSGEVRLRRFVYSAAREAKAGCGDPRGISELHRIQTEQQAWRALFER